MAAKMPTMKMPELLVFARMFVVGFVGAETFRLTFYLGSNFATQLIEVALWLKVVGIAAGLVICLTYAVKRNVHLDAARIGQSFRIDLLVAVVIGVWSNELASPWVANVHTAFKSADPHWAPAILIFLCFVLLSPLFQQHWPRPKKQTSPLYFMADEEIEDEKDDLLPESVFA